MKAKPRNISRAVALLLAGLWFMTASAQSALAQPVESRSWAQDWDALGSEDPQQAAAAVGGLKSSAGGGLDQIEQYLAPVLAASPQAIWALIRDLDDDQFAVREAAEQQLSSFGWFLAPQLKAALQASPSIETQARLERILAKNSNDSRRTYKIHLRRVIRLAGVLHEIDSPRAAEIVAFLASSTDAGPIDPALPALFEGLYSPDAQTRASSARLVIDLGDAARPAVPRLIELLGDQESFVRPTGQATVAYFMEREIPRLGAIVIDPLIEAIDDRADERRAANAVAALSRVDDEQIPELLLQLISDPQGRIALATVNNLSNLGARGVQPLIDVLGGKNPLPDRPVPESLRYRIATELGEIGDERAIEPIAAMLVGDKSGNRSVALQALIAIGAPAAEVLAQKLQSDDPGFQDDESFRPKIASAIGRVAPGEKIFELLSTATSDSNETVRRFAYSIIRSRMPIDEIYPRFWDLAVAGLAHPDPQHRWSAVSAIAEIPTRAIPKNVDRREVNQRLIELAGSDDQFLRETAIRALGNWRAVEALDLLLSLVEGRTDSTASQAAGALAGISDRRAIEPLRRLLQAQMALEYPQASGVITTIAALGSFRDSESVALLIPLLDRDESQIVQAAARALGEIGDRRAVSPLIDKLDGAADDQVLHAMTHALAKLQDPRAIGPLLYAGPAVSVLGPLFIFENGEGGSNRNAVIWPLYQFGLAAVDPLIEALDQPTDQVREVASWVLFNLATQRGLSQQDQRRIAEAMAPSLDDVSQTARFHAALALGHVNDRRALPTLLEVIGAPPPTYLKHDAATYIGQLGDPTAVAPLLVWLHDERSWVREPAARALGYFVDPQILPELLALAEDADRDVRVEVTLALARGKDPAGLEPVLRRLQDDEPLVRAAAAEALGRWSERTATAALIDASQDEQVAVRLAAGVALLRLADPQGRRIIEACLAAASSKDRETAVTQLAASGVADEPLIDALIASADDPLIRLTAIRALGTLRSSRTIEPLTAALEDEDPEIRAAAEQALMRIEP